MTGWLFPNGCRVHGRGSTRAPERPGARPWRLIGGSSALVVAFVVGTLLLLERGHAARDPAPAASEVVWVAGATPQAYVVPATQYARFLDDQASATAGDLRTLEEVATRYLEAEIEPIFRRMDERVARYTGWVYGWMSSYLISYELFIHAVGTATTEIANGRTADVAAAVEEDLMRYVTEAFRDQVIVPDETGRQIAVAWARTDSFAREAWADIWRGRRQAADRFVAAAGRPVSGIGPAAAVPGDTAPELSLGPLPSEAGIASLTAEGGEAETIFLRSVRPVVSRIAGAAMRIAFATAVGTAAGAPVGGLIGLGVGAATATAFIWSVDYGVNTVDAALHKSEFEARMRLAVDERRRATTEALRAQVAAAVERTGGAVEDAFSRAARPIARLPGPAPSPRPNG